MSRPLRVAAALVALAVLLSGPASSAGPRLLDVGRGGDGHVVVGTGPGPHAATFYAADVCLRRPGVARITDVRLRNPVGDAQVTDYTVVRGWDGMPLATAKPLRKVRSLHGTRRVKGRCGRRDHAFWVLYVEVTKPAESPAAGGDGLRISYRDGERTRVARTRWGFYLCEDVRREECTDATG
ncbi:hypothetical protein [Nocardioides dongkuii]|uniref:hypothetical protein n=1 Tax=Nocardioides dongkuii TaxID=2760089 RepID=UPI00187796E1|nr:hypothetical protein [Nocardioides dongkuii]